MFDFKYICFNFSLKSKNTQLVQENNIIVSILGIAFITNEYFYQFSFITNENF